MLTITIFCLLIVYSDNLRPSKTINLKQGLVQGNLFEFLEGDKDLLGRKLEVFRGIPFAAPPLGSLRFMPPVTASSWRGVKKTSEFSPVCPQQFPETSNRSKALLNMSAARFQEVLTLKTFLANQSEDCLYLNVYAPLQDSNLKQELYPVLLFIHGDDFEWGSGNIYDPSVFVVYGKLIVVTINYRLGILGFLNANFKNDFQHPANLGILDQIAALHWISENIANFGGNPESVTLMGHGTGAACVHFLMTANAFPDSLLFHRVIMMSGSAASSLSVSRESEKNIKLIATALNCSQENSLFILQCLRNMPLERLLKSACEISSGSVFAPTWGPTVDGVVVNNFKNDIRDYLDKLSKYDLLMGISTAEALHRLNDQQLQYGMDIHERNKFLSSFVTDTYRERQREIFSAMVTEYTDWQIPEKHPVIIRDSTLMTIQDGAYIAPLIETCDYHSSFNNNTWFYVFDYQSKNSMYKQRHGAAHGEKLKYVFGSIFKDTNSLQDIEKSISKLMMNFWSKFVLYGNPNGYAELILTNATARHGISWIKYDPKFKSYLHIGTKSKMRDHYRCKEMSLWLNLIPDLISAAKNSLCKADDSENSDLQSSKQNSMLNYKLYSELFPIVPNLKTIVSANLSPASSEVVLLNVSNNTIFQSSEFEDMTNITIISHQSFASYSTSLGVTIAVGCSLLVLNVFIFVAVYYQRDEPKSIKRFNSNSSSAETKLLCGKTDLPQIILATKNSHLNCQKPLIKKSNEIMHHFQQNRLNYVHNAHIFTATEEVQLFNTSSVSK